MKSWTVTEPLLSIRKLGSVPAIQIELRSRALKLGYIQKFVASSRTRIASVFAIVASLVVFLWPSDCWTFDIGLFVPVLLATGTWISSEIASANLVHPADAALFQKINLAFDSDSENFFREHDFGNDFRGSWLRVLDDIEALDSARDEFANSALQKKWLEFRNSTRALNHHLAIRGGYRTNSTTMYTLRSLDEERGADRSDHTWEQIRIANEKASIVIKCWQEMVKTAKKSLLQHYPSETR